MSDDLDHVIGLADEIEFASDQDAIEHAKMKLDGLDLEVWHGPRMVIRLKSTATSDRPPQVAASFC